MRNNAEVNVREVKFGVAADKTDYRGNIVLKKRTDVNLRLIVSRERQS